MTRPRIRRPHGCTGEVGDRHLSDSDVRAPARGPRSIRARVLAAARGPRPALWPRMRWSLILFPIILISSARVAHTQPAADPPAVPGAAPASVTPPGAS